MCTLCILTYFQLKRTVHTSFIFFVYKIFCGYNIRTVVNLFCRVMLNIMYWCVRTHMSVRNLLEKYFCSSVQLKNCRRYFNVVCRALTQKKKWRRVFVVKFHELHTEWVSFSHYNLWLKFLKKKSSLGCIIFNI